MMKKFFISPFFIPVFIIGICSLSLNIAYAFFYDYIPQMAQEGEFIEDMTNAGYMMMFLAFILAFRDFHREGKLKDYALFVILGGAAFFREMGAQHWLTSQDTTAIKIRFFTNPSNPMSEKIVAAAIFIFIMSCILYLLWKYGRYLVCSFFLMNPVTWGIATLLGLLVFSKFIDRFPANYAKHVGVPLSPVMDGNLEVIEEMSEAFLPLTVILILWQYHLLLKESKG